MPDRAADEEAAEEEEAAEDGRFEGVAGEAKAKKTARPKMSRCMFVSQKSMILGLYRSNQVFSMIYGVVPGRDILHK